MPIVTLYPASSLQYNITVISDPVDIRFNIDGPGYPCYVINILFTVPYGSTYTSYEVIWPSNIAWTHDDVNTSEDDPSELWLQNDVYGIHTYHASLTTINNGNRYHGKLAPVMDQTYRDNQP